MSEPRPSTVSPVARSPRAPFWAVIRSALVWGPVCGAVIAVTASIVSVPLAAVLFPVYLFGGAVVGLAGSVLGVLVALGAWSALRAAGTAARTRAIGAATAGALAVPIAWSCALLLPVDPDGVTMQVWALIAAVTVASGVLAALLRRRFVKAEAAVSG